MFINKAALISMFCMAIAGCGKGDVRKFEVSEIYCTQESSEKRAEFILSCIKNANPVSDEEPEDWIMKCQAMAERTICPRITVVKTQTCVSNGGCMWETNSIEPKKTSKDE